MTTATQLPRAALLLLVLLAASGCTKGMAAKSAPPVGNSGQCKKRVDAVVSYLDKFKDANVVSTDIAVPPSEEKKPVALAFEAKRRVLECDEGGCQLGGSTKASFDASFGKKIAGLLRPGGKCEPVYLALTATLPAAKIEPLLKALKQSGCPAFALTRHDLVKLPAVEASEAARPKLKGLKAAKTATERQAAAKTFVDSVLKPHAKACGKMEKFLETLPSGETHEKFSAIMAELKNKPRELQECICDLQGEDEKVVLQVAGFSRLGGSLSVYSAKKIDAASMATPLKAVKTWYDFVRKL